MRASCPRCNHKFFLKQLYFQEPEPSEEGREYQTLQQVYDHFPTNSNFKVARPLDYIASSHTIIMDYEKGIGFLSAISKADEIETCKLVAQAGNWLRKLHDCRKVHSTEVHTVASPSQRLTRSCEYWEEQHKPSDGTTRVAIKLLAEVEPKLDEMMDQRVWIHGDFTPDNILVNGETLIGLDVGWRSRANPVMDLAPFLNHLSLSLTTVYGFKLDRNIAELERAFINGYANNPSTEQLILLHWYRLYFLICYRYSWRGLGILRRLLTQAQLKPQISKLIEDLDIISREL
jgi:aminoglycoside phosphotransferase (APT) family kinase protein